MEKNSTCGTIFKTQQGDRWIKLKSNKQSYFERLNTTFPSCGNPQSQCLGAAQNYQVYETHNNGGRPFEVVVTTSKIFVLANDEDSDSNLEPEHILTVSDYKHVFIGFDPGFIDAAGNSFLVWTKEDDYVYIGDKVFRFKLEHDTVVDYFSPIGNNDVPYPYAITANNRIYLMLEHVSIQNHTGIQLYSTYHGFDDVEDDPYSKYYENEKLGKPFSSQLIQDSTGGLLSQWKSQTHEFRTSSIV